MAGAARIEIETLFRDPAFAGAKISPDGERIAYLAPNYGRLQVWVRGIDDDHADAICVTRDERRGIFRFQWTDNPRYLLYFQDTDGNEDWHLYRVDVENPGADAVDLTPLDAGSRVFAATPLKPKPGHVLVLMNKRPMFLDTFDLDVVTGETTVHYEATESTGNVLFDRSGDARFYTRQSDDGTTWEFHVVEEGGEKRLLRSFPGTDHPLGCFAMPTPDGAALLVVTYGDGDDLKLVRIDPATDEEVVIAARDGHSVCLAAMVGGGAPPVLTNVNTDEVMAVKFVGDKPSWEIVDPDFAPLFEKLSALSPNGVLNNIDCDEQERRFVVSFINDREPMLTYLYDRETDESRLLFKPFPWLDAEALAPMTPISFTARDGMPMHGFLTLPLGREPKNLPLVLEVHGGPWFHETWGFNREVQFFANRGYAALQVNFRGSTGYGKRHVTGAIHEFAGKMHDDLIDGVEWAVAQGYADRERVAIYGGSYGGYAALVAATFTPDVFACAIDFCGISNLANFMRTLPPFVRPAMSPNWTGYVGDPDDPAQEADMLARSPISRLDAIKNPLMVMQGAMDVRVVQEESDNVVKYLRDRGIDVEYILKENEGHGYANAENNIEAFHAIEKFLAAHIGGPR